MSVITVNDNSLDVYDIKAHGSYPASFLSNFFPNSFRTRKGGVLCTSMEGFLQSLKFEDQEIQKNICNLSGFAAKYSGKSGNGWKKTQTLWWEGKKYDRVSVRYTKLIWSAYQDMFSQSRAFRKALRVTGNSTLTHSIGRTDPKETVLTEQEFVTILMKLRQMANEVEYRE